MKINVGDGKYCPDEKGRRCLKRAKKTKSRMASPAWTPIFKKDLTGAAIQRTHRRSQSPTWMIWEKRKRAVTSGRQWFERYLRPGEHHSSLTGRDIK
ncbi:hypothetical protein DVH05_017028 [Phytophthora capsici]|nr:hypothetical protein DVH05_017028 [Phytophthora capsici]